MSAPWFCCPICGQPLQRVGRTARCMRGHSFDFAREGYLYLLPPDKKHSRSPGDDRNMVQARRRFLNAGHYAFFAVRLASIAKELLAGNPAPCVVDAGCGEGYYTARLAGALPGASLFGFDISKDAVRLAAKAVPEVSFAVASSFSLPLPDGCTDLLTDVFAPVAPAEFARIVKPGGCFVLAVPSARHLLGLKEILYAKPYENPVQDVAYPGFTLEKRVPVRGALTLTGQAVQDVFSMTPYAWKTPWTGKERLHQIGMLKTEIGFDFVIYRRNSDDFGAVRT